MLGGRTDVRTGWRNSIMLGDHLPRVLAATSAGLRALRRLKSQDRRRGCALYVMEACEPTVLEEPDQPRRLVWLGVDDRGLMLEVVAIDTPEYLLVIHVMPHDLRRRK